MRIESSVTSISWIPSEAISGLTAKLPFEMGIAHYDDPPPEVVEDLEELRQNDRFRFANELRGWIDVENGRIVGYGQQGGGQIGSTTMKVGKRSATFQAVPFADIQGEPEVGETSVRFVQTAGGRAGLVAPRPVKHKPFVQWVPPTAWTTLALTINVDGSSSFEVLGASQFPRHWVYGSDGKLAAKSGFIDFKTWFSGSFGKRTPWGDEDSEALVTEVETALERELSLHIMRSGRKPKIRKLKPGATLTEQGEEGHELFVLLDGVLGVEVDGEPLAELGPGAVLGERAVLEGGKRTATLRAVTKCKVAVAGAEDVETESLAELSEGHRREERA